MYAMMFSILLIASQVKPLTNKGEGKAIFGGKFASEHTQDQLR